MNQLFFVKIFFLVFFTNLSVKPPWPKQSGIKNLRFISSSNNNYSIVTTKTIHFCEKLIQCCDFCNKLPALLYCRADTAKLCLSCDREVHSTNPLFTKHTRSLLCDACDSTPASIYCSTHATVHCQNCDWESHSNSPENHDRRLLEGFTGTPTVTDLMAVFGFEDLSKKWVLIGGDGEEERVGSNFLIK